jgi:hypothetical protein
LEEAYMAEKETKKKNTESAEANIPTETPPDDLNAILKARLVEIDKMLADLKEKQTKIVEDESVAGRARTRDDGGLNEYVSVKLFKDNDKYKDDVYVAVNGENCVIKRGVWVKIKRKFALIIEQSEIQDIRAVEAMQDAVERFERETKKHIG